MPGARLPVSRRRFLDLTRRFGVAAAAFGALRGGSARADHIAAEERRKASEARAVMRVGLAYPVEVVENYPLVPLELKEAVEHLTGGEVHVEIRWNGVEGAGAELAAKVRKGALESAQYSISNFAPFAPAVDLLNIPYWANTNQRFLNLITSEVWQREVGARVEENGFKVLLHQVVGTRTAAARKGLGRVLKTPEDIRGLRFRVPGSRILRRFYQLCGAVPTPVPWGKTGAAVAEGRVDALDPSPAGLAIGPGNLRDHVESISFIRSVQDGAVYTLNLAWFRALPSSLQDVVQEAGAVVFARQLKASIKAAATSRRQFAEAGIVLYEPSDDEMAAWRSVGAADLRVWDDEKERLLGDARDFTRFKAAAERAGPIVMPES